MTYAAALAVKLKENQEADKKERAEREDAGKYWYPSQLGACDRRNVLQHAGVEAIPFEDRTLRLFWLGNQIHEALQASFPFKVVGHELKFRNEEYKVSGRLDTLAEVEGILESVEYKSVHDKKFAYGGLPEQSHVFQVGCSLIWPASLPDGTLLPLPERGRIVYWSKNDARIEEYIVDASEELSAAVKAEFVRLESLYQRYVADGTLPDALPLAQKKVRGKTVEVVDWRVNYCNYKGTGNCCGDKGEIDGEAGEILSTGGTDSTEV